MEEMGWSVCLASPQHSTLLMKDLNPPAQCLNHYYSPLRHPHHHFSLDWKRNWVFSVEGSDMWAGGANELLPDWNRDLDYISLSRLFLKYRRVDNLNQQGTKHSQYPEFNSVFVFVFVVVIEDDNKTNWTRDASHIESTMKSTCYREKSSLGPWAVQVVQFGNCVLWSPLRGRGGPLVDLWVGGWFLPGGRMPARTEGRR